ncbi:unnamed protein product [Soboliphyme baturini]|uniref:Uncharacterized protein n=1 Tax=Soboliphyme baturini TaxID=241478 RepID=A0A3P8DCI2_9BILA|nr:unnamed protein product [Soboliphyme baturini]
MLFWSDWTDLNEIGLGRSVAKIESSYLDGSGRKAIIDSMIHWPNGLAIDYDDGWLFWCDAFLDRIEKSRFDGGDRQV